MLGQTGRRFMFQTLVAAMAVGFVGAAAFASAPDGSLIPPNVNPGLETVPFVPASQSAKPAPCDPQLVNRVDSVSIVAGPYSLIAHIKGTYSALPGAETQLVIASTSADGRTATVDFLACRSAFVAGRPAPVEGRLVLPKDTALRSITVRAQANSLVLDPSKPQ
jgi:hypothetical protein